MPGGSSSEMERPLASYTGTTRNIGQCMFSATPIMGRTVVVSVEYTPSLLPYRVSRAYGYGASRLPKPSTKERFPSDCVYR